MITPLMLLLSMYDGTSYDKRIIDLGPLNKSDRNVILAETKRLCGLSLDPELILMTEDCFGNPMVDPEPFINGQFCKLSYPTVIILEHIREAAKIFQKSFSDYDASSDVTDLSDDNIVLRIEGNPKFVYVFVRDIMESVGMSYSEKISRLASIYRTIEDNSVYGSEETVNSAFVNRLELQSNLSFWQRVIIAGMSRHGLGDITVVKHSDIEIIKRELCDLGFYGFVNPLEMYKSFSGSRITRKVSVDIDESARTFLYKIIRSGGAA